MAICDVYVIISVAYENFAQRVLPVHICYMCCTNSYLRGKCVYLCCTFRGRWTANVFQSLKNNETDKLEQFVLLTFCFYG